MKICLDVDYRGDHAVAAGVLFHDWTDAVAAGEVVERVSAVEAYVPGQFFRRELPCLCAVLARVRDPIELILIDGYVWLADEAQPGLGGHLCETLGKSTPIIGVAKSRFRSAGSAISVFRGNEAMRPLFITAAGMDVREAAGHVQTMHGPYRIPTLLKRVDSLCRQTTASA
jgi:deoxyribonuclease V